MPNRRKYFSTEQILSMYVVDPITDCHNFTGYKNYQGYAQCSSIYSLGELSVHRISYRYYRGDIGDFHVLHKCDNPGCINPDHLFLGTHQDNMTDKKLKGRVVAHCGSKHARSKVTEDDVRKIREMKENKIPRKVIAEIFGISVPNVDDITTRATWRHV